MNKTNAKKGENPNPSAKVYAKGVMGVDCLKDLLYI